MIVYQQYNWGDETYKFCFTRFAPDCANSRCEEVYWTDGRSKIVIVTSFEKTSSNYRKVLTL